ncbi:MAG: restriction endonuclease [Candidatus Thorarchaeota archaeon]
MVLWIVRHGRRGEYEEFALQNNLVSIDWGSLPNLSDLQDKEQLRNIIHDTYPEESPNTLSNWFGQIRSFLHRIEIGDLVGIPLRTRSAIAFGVVQSDYQYEPDNPEGARHIRKVEWLETDMSKTLLPSDILQSLSSHLTVFGVRRPRAAERIRGLIGGETEDDVEIGDDEEIDDLSTSIDVQEYATNTIVQFISERYRGHELTRLVAGVLEAKGYTVNTSLGGPDGGVDILAGSGQMGFDSPRIAVQVKSSDHPAGARDIRDLKGTFDDFNAELGLFVSWGGFKDSVLRDERKGFFQIRFWDADDLVRELLLVYERLPDELKAEIPLKRVWTLVEDE